jgi:hypothetical protein
VLVSVTWATVGVDLISDFTVLSVQELKEIKAQVAIDKNK